MTIVKFKDQNYDKIKSKCLSNGELFTDHLFPAGDSILFKSKRLGTVEWKRPNQLSNNPKLIEDGLDSGDVKQGQLGNCWFVAASSVLASEKSNWNKVVPDIKEQEFDPKNPDKYCGIFKFRFWQFGEWTEVIIDDLLPTRNNNLLFVHSTSKNEFWSSLLEKAYAKLNGCYEHLDGGSLNEALQDFTGGVCETFSLKQTNRNQEKFHHHDLLFETMKKAADRKSLMTCAVNTSSSRQTEEKLPCGLYKGHAYGITKINLMELKGNSFFSFLKKNNEKLHMIRLRNPWGQGEWNGPWSDGSDNWNKVPKSERERIGLSYDDDGEFWMEFSDFLHYFDEVSICRTINTSLLSIRKTWSESEVFGRWSLPNRAGGCVNFKGTFCDNPQYLFEIVHDPEKEDEILINLDQRSLRSLGKSNLTIGFMIMKVEDNRKYRLHQPKQKTASSTFINSRSVFLRQSLPNGRYIIIPTTFDPAIESEFLLRIYSDESNNLRELTKECPVPFLARCNPFAKYASCVTSITVNSASGLINSNSEKTFDSYVLIKCEGDKLIGKLARNTLKPEYNTSAIFYRYEQKQPIEIQIWIKNSFLDELYGSVLLDAEPNNKNIRIETSLNTHEESNIRKEGRLKIDVQSMSNLTAI